MDIESRRGKKWHKEEDEQLKKSIKNNKSFEDIALEHKRSIGAIKCRIVSHIIYPHFISITNDTNNNKTSDEIINELATKYNIESDFILKYINKQNTTNTNLSENTNDISLSNRLNIIEDKLDYIIDHIININKLINLQL